MEIGGKRESTGFPQKLKLGETEIGRRKAGEEVHGTQ